MKKRHPLAWLIPLIILLLLIPFIVPSALPDAFAAELDLSDLPEYEPVELVNTDPGKVPTETIEWGKKGAKREKPVYAPHWKGFITNEEGKIREYLDGTISVRIEQRVIKKTNVFFTWIQIADPSQLRAQFANPYPITAEADADRLSGRENAVLTLTGDSCTGIRAGTVIRNGEEYRRVDATRYQQLIIDSNGDFHIIKNPTADDKIWDGDILHSFIFGPALVIDGVKQDIGKQGDYGSGITFRKNAQRNILCQMDKLSYLIITTEGPEQTGKKGGFTLYEMADIAFECGAQTAYNLDGGCTTWLVLGNERINNPQRRSARGITDIIYFVSAEEDPEPEPTPTPEPTETPEIIENPAPEISRTADTAEQEPTVTPDPPEEIEVDIDMEKAP